MTTYTVSPKLSFGPLPTGGVAEAFQSGFSVVAIVARELVYRVPPGLAANVRFLSLDDAYLIPPHISVALAAFGADLARNIKAGHRVLVCCQQGINRSALVAGLVHQQMTGCSGPAALAAVRRARHDSLWNPVFIAHLARSEAA